MTRFDRYLLRTILATSLIALAFLLAVDYIVQISVDADDLGQGNYTLAVLLLQLLLVLPEKLLLYTPAAVLIGTIMGLGQLAAQNEIAVVRAAGISRLRLARAGIAFALIVGVLNIVNGETLAPQLAACCATRRSAKAATPAANKASGSNNKTPTSTSARSTRTAALPASAVTTVTPTASPSAKPSAPPGRHPTGNWKTRAPGAPVPTKPKPSPPRSAGKTARPRRHYKPSPPSNPPKPCANSTP